MIKNTEQDAQFRVLRLIETRPEISQRQLAAELGVSLGRVNYVLRALIDKGLVKMSNFSNSPDKRRYAYVLTPKGIARKASITRSFLARKIAEYEALKSEIESLQRELPTGAPHER